ncbi:MAG TPA: hypothetical protein VNJ04_14975, partial [Gemmatimonadaceae bacterium]|nr:hypothetical protein [Gemmatimonadaceae bacterium]
MFGSGKRWALACLLTSGIFSSAVAAQERTNIRLVERLMRAAFPALVDEELRVVITVETAFESDWQAYGFVGATVAERATHMNRTDGAPAPPLLDCFFHPAPKAEYLYEVRCRGSHVNSRSQQQFEEVVRQDATWSDAKTQATLARLGAKYAPDKREDFLRDTNLKRFEPVLGSIQEAHIEFWKYEKTDGPIHVSPYWRARIVSNSGNRVMCYSLTFEAFSGRLVGLSGEPCVSADAPKTAGSSKVTSGALTRVKSASAGVL